MRDGEMEEEKQWVPLRNLEVIKTDINFALTLIKVYGLAWKLKSI